MLGVSIDPEAFRQGLFALRTRRFGKVAELLVERLIGAAGPRNQFHDLYDDIQNHRVEVKFSTASEKHVAPISTKNLFTSVAEAREDRAIAFSDWRSHEFDCNIQQVKPSEFDVLYYGIFFRDSIVIFRLEARDLATDKAIHFSDKQHKGNRGEGQFHLNARSLEHHLAAYHYATMNYAEFIALLSEDA